jgi:hypothetical protein
MTAIVIVAFAAHIAAWIVLPASKVKQTAGAATSAAMPQAARSVQMSGA